MQNRKPLSLKNAVFPPPFVSTFIQYFTINFTHSKKRMDWPLVPKRICSEYSNKRIILRDVGTSTKLQVQHLVPEYYHVVIILRLKYYGLLIFLLLLILSLFTYIDVDTLPYSPSIYVHILTIYYVSYRQTEKYFNNKKEDWGIHLVTWRISCTVISNMPTLNSTTANLVRAPVSQSST